MSRLYTVSVAQEDYEALLDQLATLTARAEAAEAESNANWESAQQHREAYEAERAAHAQTRAELAAERERIGWLVRENGLTDITSRLRALAETVAQLPCRQCAQTRVAERIAGDALQRGKEAAESALAAARACMHAPDRDAPATEPPALSTRNAVETAADPEPVK